MTEPAREPADVKYNLMLTRSLKEQLEVASADTGLSAAWIQRKALSDWLIKHGYRKAGQ